MRRAPVSARHRRGSSGTVRQPLSSGRSWLSGCSGRSGCSATSNIRGPDGASSLPSLFSALRAMRSAIFWARVRCLSISRRRFSNVWGERFLAMGTPLSACGSGRRAATAFLPEQDADAAGRPWSRMLLQDARADRRNRGATGPKVSRTPRGNDRSQEPDRRRRRDQKRPQALLPSGDCQCRSATQNSSHRANATRRQSISARSRAAAPAWPCLPSPPSPPLGAARGRRPPPPGRRAMRRCRRPRAPRSRTASAPATSGSTGHR